MAEITALNNFLDSLGITQTSKIKMALTDSNFTSGEPLKLTNLTDYTHLTTISDLNVMVPYLTELISLTSLVIHESDITKRETGKNDSVQAFTKDHLTELDAMTLLADINIYKQELCIAADHLTHLNRLKLNYAQPHPSIFSSEQGTLQFCAGAILSTAAGTDHNTNAICSDVDTSNVPQGITLPTGSCTSGCSGGGGDCITSVSISGTSLVIQTGPCGGTPTTLNTPVSDSTDVSYTKCTNCGNSKTLLRNEVDEVVDDSSALYNRDSNNEVCNHCLVSIGDEKHCNRFLDKEDCNYLGDSYAWVGA